jgi:nucleotide-binding universal stress UspA family protein
MIASRSRWRELVVGFSEGESGRDALFLARLLQPATGARLRILRFSGSSGPSGRGRSEEYSRLARRLRDEVAAAGAEADALEVLAESPVSGFRRLAAARAEQIIVLGSTHRAGLGRVHPGSVAERALEVARCPVAVAPRGVADLPGPAAEEEPALRTQLRVVAVGFDGREESRGALEMATEIALGAEATLRVIAVTPDAAHGSGSRLRIEDELHDSVRALPSELRALPVHLRGLPAEQLLAQAEQGVDLFVIGSRGEGPVHRIALGSTSTELMRASACPVLIASRPG